MRVLGIAAYAQHLGTSLLEPAAMLPERADLARSTTCKIENVKGQYNVFLSLELRQSHSLTRIRWEIEVRRSLSHFRCHALSSFVQMQYLHLPGGPDYYSPLNECPPRAPRCGIMFPIMDKLKLTVKRYARELGFDLVGVASAQAFADHQAVTLQRVRDGLMDGLPWYTEARVRRGCDPQQLLPSARSIIAVGMSYHASGGSGPGAAQGKVARYAWGDDYHRLMKSRLKELVEGLSRVLDRTVAARWYVDDGPMLERASAQRAGIGWYGKNTNILSSSHGSWVFLGQVVTDLDLTPDPPLKKTCGSCVRCIEACPTGAIVAPYVIDNTRCISHLTIENRGPIPRALRPLIQDWVFGCDICQDVCPVNFKAPYSTEPDFHDGQITSVGLVEILDMTEAGFRERFGKSPIKRAKLAGLQRNACVALGNVGDQSAVPALVRALCGEEPLVRGHAAWALGVIAGPQAMAALAAAKEREDDESVLEEIKLAQTQAQGAGLT